ncbi:DUF3237 domain-containing protein [Blastococcus saxobsidens]|uniref:UPF0311 protein BLASA_1699 n=1 Tax=Blastococcus saxobsidens (strain DD2) TaxID=1146883 RepID=H6RN72_BLASD|nr:DUF3237 domain-containing protein [Blastococcus saxobsidens]CCG02620.1 conserved protein of unknown function [Blastococcus saxobsidens DD2]
MPDHAPATPQLSHTATLRIEVGSPVEVGVTSRGIRRVIPITGGRVTGPLMQGEIIPGGADFQVITSTTDTELEARYVLRTDQDELVYVTNWGLRTGTVEDIERLRQDLPVDPDRIYFRTAPRFETAAPRLAELNRRLFIGVGTRRPDAVLLDVFMVQ